jgi:hypothetical protein
MGYPTSVGLRPVVFEISRRFIQPPLINSKRVAGKASDHYFSIHFLTITEVQKEFLLPCSPSR